MTMNYIIILISLLGVFQNIEAQTFMPEKKSHLFQTNGLFTEEGQTAIFNQGGSRYWVELAARMAVLEFDQQKLKPQLIINAGVMDSLRYEKKEFQSDTQDLRIGLALLMTLDPQTRFMVSLSHLSGHVLEDIPNKALIPVDVGDESFGFRLIHDYEEHFRFGGDIKYIFGTVGGVKRASADQFFEWMPLGEKGLKSKYTPYAAFGFEENGYLNYYLSSHIQTGIYWGNHLAEKHSEIVKLLLGYYSGLDPRQKVAHFEHSKAQYLYGGLAYEY